MGRENRIAAHKERRGKKVKSNFDRSQDPSDFALMKSKSPSKSMPGTANVIDRIDRQIGRSKSDSQKQKFSKFQDKLMGEGVKRDEYGDIVGGPKISKKQKAKNLTKNEKDEQHTTTTS